MVTFVWVFNYYRIKLYRFPIDDVGVYSPTRREYVER